MGILDTAKIAIDRLTGEEKRRQEREQLALREQQAAEKTAFEKRAADQEKARRERDQQTAKERAQAAVNRQVEDGPAVRLWGGPLPPPLPQPVNQPAERVPTRQEPRPVAGPPGLGPAVQRPGQNYRNDRLPDDTREAQPVQPDIYDRTMQRRINAEQAEQHRRGKLTQVERDSEDLLKDLQVEAQRGRRENERGLGMSRVRERE